MIVFVSSQKVSRKKIMDTVMDTVMDTACCERREGAGDMDFS